MTTGEADYYILPSTWCETCRRQVSCNALIWEVAGERLATFICPGCGQTLGVGLHGETSWSPRHATGRRQWPDESV
jgi:hypothetical protein